MSAFGRSFGLRSPLLHFLVLGGLLFSATSGRSPSDTEPPEAGTSDRIAIDSARLEELRQDLARRLGRPPGSPETQRLLAAEIDEELLYQEALRRGMLRRDEGVRIRLIEKMLFLDSQARPDEGDALAERAFELGLHRDDVVVRRILVQRMRLLGSALRDQDRPGPPAIARRYARDREAYRRADRIDLHHVFLSADHRGEAAHAQALALRTRLEREGTTPARAVSSGDPFAMGHRLQGRTARDLERRLGGEFGDPIFTLEPGRWTGPIASAYGQHLLFIDRVERGEVPPLEAVANRIRREIEQERRAARLASLLARLRARAALALGDDNDEGHGEDTIPTHAMDRAMDRERGPREPQEAG